MAGVPEVKISDAFQSKYTRNTIQFDKQRELARKSDKLGNEQVTVDKLSFLLSCIVKQAAQKYMNEILHNDAGTA